MKDFFSRHGGRLFRRRRRLFRLLLGGLRGGLLGLLGPGIGLLLLGMGPCGDELGRYVLVVAVEEGVLGGELLSLFLSELNSFLDLDPLCPPLSLSPSLPLSLSLSLTRSPGCVSWRLACASARYARQANEILSGSLMRTSREAIFSSWPAANARLETVSRSLRWWAGKTLGSRLFERERERERDVGGRGERGRKRRRACARERVSNTPVRPPLSSPAAFFPPRRCSDLLALFASLSAFPSPSLPLSPSILSLLERKYSRVRVVVLDDLAELFLRVLHRLSFFFSIFEGFVFRFFGYVPSEARKEELRQKKRARGQLPRERAPFGRRWWPTLLWRRWREEARVTGKRSKSDK